MIHQLIITLGSNHQAEIHLPQVLLALQSLLNPIECSPVMHTTPIDFPYPSPLFTNYVIWGETDKEEAVIREELKALEISCGRNQQSRRDTPHRVTADIDLIIWDNEIRKPRDLHRPYLIEGLNWLQTYAPASKKFIEKLTLSAR